MQRGICRVGRFIKQLVQHKVDEISEVSERAWKSVHNGQTSSRKRVVADRMYSEGWRCAA
jgi:hypothetical protein